MGSKVIVRAIFFLVLGAVAACVGLLPLIWDGGYQLAVSLINQEPYFYLTRFHSWILWWPAVWLSRVTENATALSLAYGLPFLLAPAVSLAASWAFVREKAPGLVVWAAFGIAVSLPGQAFVINDSILQHTLAWPVILGAMVRLGPVQTVLWLALACFQFSHQIGILILAFAAGASWYANAPLRQTILAGILCALAIGKTIWISIPSLAGRFYDSYAAQEATLQSALWAFLTGVVGLPLAGLVVAWVVAWKCLQRETGSKPLPSWWWKASLTVFGLWVIWAAIPNFWASSINYRRWVVPLAFPFVVMTAMDARRGRPLFSEWRERVVSGVSVLFAVVLTLQGAAWLWQLSRLQSDLASNPKPVVFAPDLPRIKTYQLDHWGITSTMMVLQGRAPSQYLAYDPASLAAISKEPREVSLWAPHPIPAAPGAAGWFDHRPLLSQLRGESAPGK